MYIYAISREGQIHEKIYAAIWNHIIAFKCQIEYNSLVADFPLNRLQKVFHQDSYTIQFEIS